jgi:hypothetical protein
MTLSVKNQVAGDLGEYSDSMSSDDGFEMFDYTNFLFVISKQIIADFRVFFCGNSESQRYL